MKKETRLRRVTFRYHAPDAKSIFLAGSFNGWNESAKAMKRGRDGTWSATVNLHPGEYENSFVVDGEWKTDPACDLRYPHRYGGYNSFMLVG